MLDSVIGARLKLPKARTVTLSNIHLFTAVPSFHDSSCAARGCVVDVRFTVESPLKMYSRDLQHSGVLTAMDVNHHSTMLHDYPTQQGIGCNGCQGSTSCTQANLLVSLHVCRIFLRDLAIRIACRHEKRYIDNHDRFYEHVFCA
jgi:hypothetical protein